MKPVIYRNASNTVKLFYALVATACVLGFVVFVLLIAAAVRIGNQSSLPEICVNRDCVWESSELLRSISPNRSIDACDDFYEFACGNFASVWPADDVWGMTITQIIEEENRRKLEAILGKSPDGAGATEPKSHEEKLKVFYESCTNEFEITSRSATPIFTVISNLYGWNAIDPYLSGGYTRASLGYLLRTAHAQYGMSPFFEIKVLTDYDYAAGSKLEKHIVSINEPTLGLYHYQYASNETESVNMRSEYRKYITTVVTQLQKDSGKTIANAAAIADRVATDILNVERRLAEALRQPSSWRDADKTDKSLRWLDETYGDVFSWYSLISQLYAEAHLTKNAIVYMSHPEYIQGIESVIRNITNRELNSYFIWKLVDKYVDNLGWNYAHTLRTWKATRLGNWYVREFKAAKDACFSQAQIYLGYALAGLYVEKHYAEQKHRQVVVLKDIMKEVAAKQIDTIPWMDTETKIKAKAKLAATSDKFGYPEWLGDRKRLDNYYSTLKVESGKHFENVLNLIKFGNRVDAMRLTKPFDANEWSRYQIHTTTYYYTVTSNELIFPSGLLQHPVFDHRVPQYINFGALGRFIGKTLLAVISFDQGARYDEKGHSVSGTWWSQQTKDNYQNVYNISGCFSDTYAKDGFAGWEARSLGKSTELELAGLRIAYESYREFERRYGAEPMLPGLQWSNADHAFFLSYAQTFCRSYLPTQRWLEAQGRATISRILENTKEFGDAYQCKAGQRLATQPDFCPGYYK